MHVQITSLVDNCVRLGTTLWAEHGLALLVHTSEGAVVLLDTGQSGGVLAHNAGELEAPLDQTRAIVLSHGHYDHAGGLRAALGRTGPVPVIAHPDVLRPRSALGSKGAVRDVGLPFSQRWIEQHAELRLSAEPVEVAPGVVATGPIPRDAGPTPRDERLVVPVAGGGWAPDPFADDQALVLDAEPGLVVLLGCCHAGLINTLTHAQNLLGRSIHAVVGGTHLGGASPSEVQQVIAELRDRFHPALVVPGHCTGQAAYAAFVQADPDHVEPCAAGWQRSW